MAFKWSGIRIPILCARGWPQLGGSASSGLSLHLAGSQHFGGVVVVFSPTIVFSSISSPPDPSDSTLPRRLSLPLHHFFTFTFSSLPFESSGDSSSSATSQGIFGVVNDDRSPGDFSSTAAVLLLAAQPNPSVSFGGSFIWAWPWPNIAYGVCSPLSLSAIEPFISPSFGRGYAASRHIPTSFSMHYTVYMPANGHNCRLPFRPRERYLAVCFAPGLSSSMSFHLIRGRPSSGKIDMTKGEFFGIFPKLFLLGAAHLLVTSPFIILVLPNLLGYIETMFFFRKKTFPLSFPKRKRPFPLRPFSMRGVSFPVSISGKRLTSQCK